MSGGLSCSIYHCYHYIVSVSFLALLVLATAGVMMWLISLLELATFRFSVDCDLASTLRELPVSLIPATTGVVG
jgi:hypothetical protein